VTNRILLDTCVVSYVLKQDSRASVYEGLMAGFAPVISFMTLAELYRWPLERNWGESRSNTFFNAIRQYTVLPFCERVCWHWAHISQQLGRPMPDEDAWIAACALAFNIPLLTHNRKDFSHLSDLDLISAEKHA
jgi:tRNA(fMet)-specific endonuclease VapC